MRKLLKYLGCVLVAAFACHAQNPALADAHTGRDLDNEYLNVHPTNCDQKPSQPAFLCSGILLRGTQYSPQYHSWNPSPVSVKDGGVSFSYLREDAQFTRMALSYSHGLIIYPIFSAPKDKIDLDVLCAFPTDAWTNYRADQGCGTDPTYGAASRPCQDQGITTGQQWFQHYQAANNNQPYYYECGFNVRDQNNVDSAQAFHAMLDGMHLLGGTQLNQPLRPVHEQNEVRIATWPQDIGDRLPIQAFFYTESAGLAGAQSDQKDFYNTYKGMFVPVVELNLPSESRHASFYFNMQDQAVPVPQ